MVPHKLRPNPRIRRAVLAGGVALAAVAASVGVVMSASASVPPTPSGWTQIFAEDFNGAANSLPNSSTWRFSTGHNYPGGPAELGHRRDPELHGQSVQREPGRQRQPAHHPTARRRGQLDLGPHRDEPPRLQGSGRRRAAHRGTHPDAQCHRRAGARVLAGVLGARRSVPGHLQLARGRRVRHHGERQRHQRRVGRAALRGGAGRSVQ